jgi:hypothetical protein
MPEEFITTVMLGIDGGLSTREAVAEAVITSCDTWTQPPTTVDDFLEVVEVWTTVYDLVAA